LCAYNSLFLLSAVRAAGKNQYQEKTKYGSHALKAKAVEKLFVK
jgi:hypothetical protein